MSLSSPPLRLPLTLMALSIGLIAAFWAWAGRPHPLPPWPLAAGEKLFCMSYTPFQPGQSPFDTGLIVSPQAIASDLDRLAPLTDCIRTYSAASNGIDAVADAASAKRLHLFQGAWISRDPIANNAEIEAAINAAKRHPETVKAIIAGNEVLLRREQTAEQLVALIKTVKSRTDVPVTYADVWEFWLKNPSVADAVDFLMIHILPYWEDHPVSAEDASQHVLEITRKLQQAFPGKEIVIGEVGWPSAGRMREPALPSLYNQARVITDVIADTKKAGIRANLIEAFDQPWKRQLEGTVGGHWGLFDAYQRNPKFPFGGSISNHAYANSLMAAGICLALFAFFSAVVAARGAVQPATPRRWFLAAVTITTSAILFGLAAVPLIDGAFGIAGTLRALALGLMTALAAFQAVAIVTGTPPASFASLLGSEPPPSTLIARFAGLFVMIAMVIAVYTALTLCFDARYAELPYAEMSAIVIAVVGLPLASPTAGSRRGTLNAERAMAAVTGATSLVILLNEGLSNWQAVWLAAAMAALSAVMLWRTSALPTSASS